MAGLDMTLDPVEETRVKQKYSALCSGLLQTLHFTPLEMDGVVVIYHKVQKEKDGVLKGVEMTRTQFREVLYSCFDMTDDTLIERIFVALDKNGADTVPMEVWATALSLWLRGTLDEKIAYCFAVYDLMGDGMIKRETMFQLLRGCVVKPSDEDIEEGVKDMVDIVMKRLDIDRDGVVSFKDYSTAVHESPMMLECMGECMPKRNAVHAFLSTFVDDCGEI